MNPLYVTLSPGDGLSFATTVELQGPNRTVSVRLAFRWLARLGRWAVLLTTPDQSVALSMQQLVVPGGDLVIDKRDDRAPEGRLTWAPGPDPYRRTDLGQLVRLAFVPEAA